MTVYELCSKSISKRNIRRNTEITYQRMLNSLEKDKLAYYSVKNVKISAAKEWGLRMKEKGLSYTTVNHDKQILKSSFQMVV